MQIPQPLVLFIDAYDSFSNNIISLLETTLSCSVRTIKIDNPILLTSESALQEELRHYAAVVCGPGPGHPAKEDDVGIIKKIWKLGEDDLLPVLGICLGFQSLCLEFGGDIRRLKGPQHGIIRRVAHIGERGSLGEGTIFEGVGEVKATHYQSLCVDIGQDEVQSCSWDSSKWGPPTKCPDLVPLAYVESDLSVANDSGVKDERVLVAVRHASKPFWALQYHPESICTDEESNKVIKNWFKHAQQWDRTRRQGRIDFKDPPYGEFAIRESLLGPFEGSGIALDTPFLGHGNEVICHTRTIDFPGHMIVPELAEAIQDMRRDHIVLESTNANEKLIGTADVRGRFSIIALDVDDAPRFEYTVGSDFVSVTCQGVGNQIDLRNYGGIWPFLAQHLDKRQTRQGNMESPFWGGFMGYTTYELGLDTIGVNSQGRETSHHSRPDLCFVWVTRSLVVDHVRETVAIQELAPRNAKAFVDTWMNTIVERLEKAMLPWESYLPLCITLSNIPLHVTKDQLLDAIRKIDANVLPYYVNYFIKDETFTGVATARYMTEEEASVAYDKLQDMEICGQSVQIRVEGMQISVENDGAGNKHSCQYFPTTHSSTSSPVDCINQTMKVRAANSAESTPPTSLSSGSSTPSNAPSENSIKSILSIRKPTDPSYESKVLRCQEFISSGDSYELCLTDRTTITRQKPTSSAPSWDLYKTLRARQPAPFASYIRIGTATLVSSSPERFLTWDHNNHCSLRPMKGTVRKTSIVNTLEKAKKLLDVPKEKAENLMIVDLVRHDLHGVCGSGNVQVPRLCVVEEYKSVFQMISVVEGQIPAPKPGSEEKRRTGLDVLAASLPPGSMTGAPKKRSCEILQGIEDKERGLYSGVVGYIDVRGRGDWSVTIRSMFKWDDEDSTREIQVLNEETKTVETERWHIGAGGAVTTLSTAVGEREEMQTKLNGTLSIFL